MKFTQWTLLIYGLFLMIGHAYAAEVLIIPPTQIIAPGTIFYMNISVDPQGTAIAGAQMNIAFDQSLIRMNSVTEGDLFTQSAANTFFNSGIINNTSGTVINIFDTIIGRKNVSSQGNFIIINATAIGSSGTSIINLSNVKLSDPDGNPVALNVTYGFVRINSPPLLTNIGNRTINEGQMLTFTLSGSDADGDVLIYECMNLPAGATFDQATRSFQWTPGFNQAGSYQNVQFEVSDGMLADLENITITVNNMNGPPIFTSTPADGSVFMKNHTVEISIMANDPDNDPLSYSIKINGVQVSTSSNYSWITNYSNTGSHNIDLTVSDGKTSVTKTTTIFINDPVQELMISNITVTSGKNYILDTLAAGKLEYIDRTYTFNNVPSSYTNLRYIRTANGDKASTFSSFLQFDVNMDVIVYIAHDDRITTKPSWLSSFIDTGNDLEGKGGKFSLYAGNFSAGHISLGGNYGGGFSMYNVVIASRANKQTINNNPPVLTEIGNKMINEGQILSFTISATDLDGDILSYKATNLPAGATFNQVTRTFQWTPDFTQAGSYQNVQFEVSDGKLTDLENITINVLNMNPPPAFISTPSNGSVFIKNDTVEISITANDPDDDPLSYSIKIDGILVSTLPNYSWNTTNSDPGNHNIDLSVSDGTTTITKTTSVYINELIQGLVISNITSASGKSYTIDNLGIKKSQYIDRTYTFGSIPSRYSSLTIIKTANDDKAYSSASFLEFNVNQNVTVYVAHDDRITLKPSWLNSFTDTDDNLTSGAGTFSIFARNYTAGSISLGGNSGSGYSMYSVVIRSNP